MFKVGDLVKVKKAVNYGLEIELYPVGTVCQIIEVSEHKDGTSYRVVRLEDLQTANENSGWWYKPDEVFVIEEAV